MPADDAPLWAVLVSYDWWPDTYDADASGIPEAGTISGWASPGPTLVYAQWALAPSDDEKLGAIGGDDGRTALVSLEDLHSGVVYGMTVRCVDLAGSIGPASSFSVAVDLSPPATALGAGVPATDGGFVSATAEGALNVQLWATEPGCTFAAELLRPADGFEWHGEDGEDGEDGATVRWVEAQAWSGIAGVDSADYTASSATLTIDAQLVPDGVYTVRAAATDAAGQSSLMPVHRIVRIDSTQPTSTMTPSIGAVTQDAEWLLTVRCYDASPCHVTAVVDRLSDDLASVVDAAVLTLTNATNSTWSSDGDTGVSEATLVVGPTEPDHAYRVSVSVIDFASNAMVADTAGDLSFTWQRDLQPPDLTVSVWHVATAARTQADAIVVADAAVAAGQLPDWVVVSGASDAGARHLQGADVGAGASGADAGSKALAYRNTVTVVRASCAEDSVLSSCTVRLQLRQLELARIACGAAASEGGGASSSSIADGFRDWTVLPPDTVVSAGAAVVFTASMGDMADGLWALALEALDDAGNVAHIPGSQFHIDSAAPVEPALASPAVVDGVLSLAYATVTLEVTDVSPRADLATAVFELSSDELTDGGAQATVPVQAVQGEELVRATINVGAPPGGASQLGPDALPDGSYILTGALVDAAGNPGQSTPLSFEVQTTPPTTRVFRTPAPEVGTRDVVIGFEALDSITGAPLVGAGFDVSDARGGGFQPVCTGSNDGRVVSRSDPSVGNGCVYTFAADQLLTYTLQVRTRNAAGLADGDPITVTFTVLECTDTQYAELNATDGAIECFDCPPGADCSDPLVSLEQVGASGGFWASQQVSGQQLQFFKCPIEHACLGVRHDVNGTLVSMAECAPGFGGRLCAACLPGWTLQWGDCVLCPQSEGGTAAVISGIVAAMLVALVLAVRLRRVIPSPVVKIFISWAQIMASAQSAITVKWPSAFGDLLDALKVVLLDIVTLSRAECAQPMTFYASLYITVFAFVGVSAGAMWVLAWRDKHRADAVRPLVSPTSAASAARRNSGRGGLLGLLSPVGTSSSPGGSSLLGSLGFKGLFSVRTHPHTHDEEEASAARAGSGSGSSRTAAWSTDHDGAAADGAGVKASGGDAHAEEDTAAMTSRRSSAGGKAKASVVSMASIMENEEHGDQSPRDAVTRPEPPMLFKHQKREDSSMRLVALGHHPTTSVDQMVESDSDSDDRGGTKANAKPSAATPPSDTGASTDGAETDAKAAAATASRAARALAGDGAESDAKDTAAPTATGTGDGDGPSRVNSGLSGSRRTLSGLPSFRSKRLTALGRRMSQRAIRAGAPALQAMVRATMAARRVAAGPLRLRWELVFKKLSMFWLLCYPGVSVKLLRVFKCVEIENAWYLEADLRLPCFDGPWAAAGALSLLLIVTYTIGLPVGISIWLWRNRKTLHTENTKQHLGFLYRAYGTAAYAWEAVELGRKLILTSLVIFFESGSPVQLAFALLVSGWAHVAFAAYKPCKEAYPPAYVLQHVSLFITTFVYALGLLISAAVFAEDEVRVAGKVDEGSVITGLGVVLVGLSGVFIVCSVALFAYQFRANMRRNAALDRAKAELAAASSGGAASSTKREGRTALITAGGAAAGGAAGAAGGAAAADGLKHGLGSTSSMGSRFTESMHDLLA